MNASLSRLLATGVDPGDDEDTRLRKFLLLAATLTITPLAAAWGAVVGLLCAGTERGHLAPMPCTRAASGGARSPVPYPGE